eukprot:scaffold200016_cov36-Prasinocladus_malaysianus.AAC.1
MSSGNVANGDSSHPEPRAAGLTAPSDRCFGGVVLLSCSGALVDGTPAEQQAAVDLTARLRSKALARQTRQSPGPYYQPLIKLKHRQIGDAGGMLWSLLSNPNVPTSTRSDGDKDVSAVA